MATDTSQSTTPRRRRADGERSHEAILTAAAQLATIEGLDGLSIGKKIERAAALRARLGL